MILVMKIFDTEGGWLWGKVDSLKVCELGSENWVIVDDIWI